LVLILLISKKIGWLGFLLRDFSNVPFMGQPDLMTRDTCVQRLSWFDFYIFVGSFFFTIRYYIIGPSASWVCCFSFYEIIPISYPGSQFDRVTQVELVFFLYFLLIFFFSFAFNYFVHLRIHLHCFIPFLLCRVISPS